MPLTPAMLRSYLKAVGDTYQQAIRRLGPRELREFMVHEAHWLTHIPAWDGLRDDSEELMRLRTTQAADYLKTTLAGKASRRRRNNLLKLLAVELLLSSRELVERTIDRLT